jgi:hypothetical protein
MSRGSGSQRPGWPGAWLERFGIWISATWGLAEATLFFVVPDVIVGAVGLYRPKKAVAAGVAAVGGALVGGTLVYLVGTGVGDGLRSVMDAVPSIRPEMLLEARQDLLDQGGRAMFLGPSQSIPYKIYATEWSLLGWGLPALLAWTIPDRAVRIVSVGLLMAGVGVIFRRHIQDHPGFWLVLYAGSWTVFYVVYWVLILPTLFGSS